MGWAGLLGALGQGIGGQMMKDREQERELKIRQQLEEAQQKRQMFLEKYRSDLSLSNQTELARQADERKTQDELENYSKDIKATRGGVIGYNARGDYKKLRDLTPEEQADLDFNEQYRKQALANQTANTQSMISARKDAEEERALRRQQREAEAKLTPEEKEELERRKEIAKQTAKNIVDTNFISGLSLPQGMQEGTPEYTRFIANQAFARAKASDEVVYGNSPFKEKPPTREEILAKAQQSLAARPDLKDQIEKLKKQMLAQYGYAE